MGRSDAKLIMANVVLARDYYDAAQAFHPQLQSKLAEVGRRRVQLLPVPRGRLDQLLSRRRSMRSQANPGMTLRHAGVEGRSDLRGDFSSLTDASLRQACGGSLAASIPHG